MLSRLLWFLLLTTIVSCQIIPIEISSECKLAYRKAILDGINSIRTGHQVANLTLSGTLNTKAQSWALEMIKSGYFGPSNSTFRGDNGETLTNSTYTVPRDLSNPANCAALGSNVANFYYYGKKYWDFSKSVAFNSSDRHIGYYFSQAVWKSSTQVGFGFSAAQVDGAYKYFSVTWYSPAGNIDGQYAANVLPYKA